MFEGLEIVDWVVELYLVFGVFDGQLQVVFGGVDLFGC